MIELCRRLAAAIRCHHLVCGRDRHRIASGSIAILIAHSRLCERCCIHPMPGPPAGRSEIGCSSQLNKAVGQCYSRPTPTAGRLGEIAPVRSSSCESTPRSPYRIAGFPGPRWPQGFHALRRGRCLLSTPLQRCRGTEVSSHFDPNRKPRCLKQSVGLSSSPSSLDARLRLLTAEIA